MYKNKSLEDALNVEFTTDEPAPTNQLVLTKSSDLTDVEKRIRDFDLARDNILELIEVGKVTLNNLTESIKDTNLAMPFMYEAIAGIMDKTSKLNNQLLEIHKKKKELEDFIKPEIKSIENQTNNIVFTGDTSKLDEYLKSKLKG